METFWPGLQTRPHETRARPHGRPGCRGPRPATAPPRCWTTLRGRHFECAEAVFVTNPEGRLEGGRPHQRSARRPARPGDGRDHGSRSIRPCIPIRTRRPSPWRPCGSVSSRCLWWTNRSVCSAPCRRRPSRASCAASTRRTCSAWPVISRDGDTFARGVLEAPLGDRLRRRLPWLVIGLLASSLATAGGRRLRAHPGCQRRRRLLRAGPGLHRRRDRQSGRFGRGCAASGPGAWRSSRCCGANWPPAA